MTSRFSSAEKTSYTCERWSSSATLRRTRVAIGDDVEARDARRPQVGAQGGGQDAQQRALARPVAAGQHRDLARGEAEAHPDQRPAGAVPLRDFVDFDPGHGGRGCDGQRGGDSSHDRRGANGSSADPGGVKRLQCAGHPHWRN